MDQHRSQCIVSKCRRDCDGKGTGTCEDHCTGQRQKMRDGGGSFRTTAVDQAEHSHRNPAFGEKEGIKRNL